MALCSDGALRIWSLSGVNGTVLQRWVFATTSSPSASSSASSGAAGGSAGPVLRGTLRVVEEQWKYAVQSAMRVTILLYSAQREFAQVCAVLLCHTHSLRKA